jgi:hypothetical protein
MSIKLQRVKKKHQQTNTSVYLKICQKTTAVYEDYILNRLRLP